MMRSTPIITNIESVEVQVKIQHQDDNKNHVRAVTKK